MFLACFEAFTHFFIRIYDNFRIEFLVIQLDTNYGLCILCQKYDFFSIFG